MNEKPRETVIYEITPDRSRFDCIRYRYIAIIISIYRNYNSIKRHNNSIKRINIAIKRNNKKSEMSLSGLRILVKKIRVLFYLHARTMNVLEKSHQYLALSLYISSICEKSSSSYGRSVFGDLHIRHFLIDTSRIRVLYNLSHLMTKQTMWLRSAWASTQSDQSLRCPHEESLGP